MAARRGAGRQRWRGVHRVPHRRRGRCRRQLRRQSEPLGSPRLTAGALSMALGEYVSVASQRDIEQADLRIERKALEEHPVAELRELAQIWEARGVEPELALEVARQLTEQGRARGARPRRARADGRTPRRARCRRHSRRCCRSRSARWCRWWRSWWPPTTAVRRWSWGPRWSRSSASAGWARRSAAATRLRADGPGRRRWRCRHGHHPADRRAHRRRPRLIRQTASLERPPHVPAGDRRSRLAS